MSTVFLTLEEIRERTGRDVETLRRWIKAHKIPAEWIGGKVIDGRMVGGQWMIAETLIPYIKDLPAKPWKRKV